MHNEEGIDPRTTRSSFGPSRYLVMIVLLLIGHFIRNRHLSMWGEHIRETVPLLALESTNSSLLKNYRNDTNARSPDATHKVSVQSQDAGPRFAYAFIVSGCDPMSCYGYVLNAVIAKHVLQQHKSIADVVLKIRMTSNSNSTRLDPSLERLLQASNIHWSYLNKVRTDNFGSATLEKFRVFEMLEYDRVLFLDSDIIPLCNMDYIFWESYRPGGKLSEYTAVAGTVAPATGAILLVTPRPGVFGAIMDIVRKHWNRTEKPREFDETLGWGHVIDPRDQWHTRKKSGSTWKFKGATAGQGLLYHWLKYEQLNYTQVNNKRIYRFREVTHDHEYRTKNPAKVFSVGGGRYVTSTMEETMLPGCRKEATLRRRKYDQHPPYSDYFHFSGRDKPWNIPKHWKDITAKLSMVKSGTELWYFWLRQVDGLLQLGLPDVIQVPKSNPLGLKDFGTDLFGPGVELPEPAM